MPLHVQGAFGSMGLAQKVLRLLRCTACSGTFDDPAEGRPVMCSRCRALTHASASCGVNPTICAKARKSYGDKKLAEILIDPVFHKCYKCKDLPAHAPPHQGGADAVIQNGGFVGGFVLVHFD